MMKLWWLPEGESERNRLAGWSDMRGVDVPRTNLGRHTPEHVLNVRLTSTNL